MRKWIGVVLVISLIAALGGWGYLEATKRAWIRINEYDVRSEGTLQVGDLAPDVELLAVDGSRSRHISELHEDKPLVLVFGSYT